MLFRSESEYLRVEVDERMRPRVLFVRWTGASKVTAHTHLVLAPLAASDERLGVRCELLHHAVATLFLQLKGIG